MKIALAQINPTIGAIDKNREKIGAFCERAKELGADLAVFPELALTGYPPKDLLERAEFIDRCENAVEQLVESVTGISVLCGYVERLDRPNGRNLGNSAILFRDGKILAKAQKILLPTYDVFDELRYFISGGKPTVGDIDGTKIGITICEDIWNMPGFSDTANYDKNPVEQLIHSGADIIINLSASPYRLGMRETRMKLGRAITKKYKTPFILVNQVGGNDDLLFDGHSFALSADGVLVAQAKGFEEEMVMVDTKDWSGDIRTIAINQDEKIFNALVMGVRDYLRKCGFKRAVIGLSGGIDSAVVAVLAAHALGAENVTGISMPSEYTAKMSEDDANTLAKNIGINFHTIPIKRMFELYKEMLEPIFGERREDVTEENLQARIRGDILMAVSNKFGSMVLSTGNKSEMACGYCTLYGDMAGGLAVISDLPKTSVYKLAEWMNREREIIPSNVLTRAPSAELRPDQTDQQSLPPYDILDKILEGYVENHESPEQLIKRGFDKEIVLKITAMVDRSEYKRQQAPPGLKISGKAFGSGRRIPIVQGYS